MMKRETFSHEKIAGLEAIQKTNKTIVLPFDEKTYSELVENRSAYFDIVTDCIETCPELFPDTIGSGWSLYGFTKDSVKQGVRVRRIVTLADNEVWQIRPSFVMPYMTCFTSTAEKILFLKKWVPSWALAQVFEKDVMAIHRLTNHMGRYSIVGTTVKAPSLLPTDAVADEKHSVISGEKVYIATTAAEQCFLGDTKSVGAGEHELTEAYRQFQTEAQQVQPSSQPNTVNTDGWQATMKAWQKLFPSICLVQCFLHAILSIRNVSTKATKDLYNLIVDKAWQVYEANTKRHFSKAFTTAP